MGGKRSAGGWPAVSYSSRVFAVCWAWESFSLFSGVVFSAAWRGGVRFRFRHQFVCSVEGCQKWAPPSNFMNTLSFLFFSTILLSVRLEALLSRFPHTLTHTHTNTPNRTRRTHLLPRPRPLRRAPRLHIRDQLQPVLPQLQRSFGLEQPWRTWWPRQGRRTRRERWGSWWPRAGWARWTGTGRRTGRRQGS